MEIAQVGVDIERKPMRRDPAGNVDAHSNKLVVPYPDARQTWIASGLNVVRRGDLNEDLFKRTHVPRNIAAVFGKVKNRITDQLTRTMIGDVATPVSLKDPGAESGQSLCRDQQVLSVCGAAQRV